MIQINVYKIDEMKRYQIMIVSLSIVSIVGLGLHKTEDTDDLLQNDLFGGGLSLSCPFTL